MPLSCRRGRPAPSPRGVAGKPTKVTARRERQTGQSASCWALGSTVTRPGRPSEARVGNPATDLSASDDADVVAVCGSDGTTDAPSPEPPMPAGRKPLPAAKDTGVPHWRPALGARDGRWVTVPAAADRAPAVPAAADVSPTSAEATPERGGQRRTRPAPPPPAATEQPGKARRAPVVSERRRLGTEPATNNPRERRWSVHCWGFITSDRRSIQPLEQPQMSQDRRRCPAGG